MSQLDWAQATASISTSSSRSPDFVPAHAFSPLHVAAEPPINATELSQGFNAAYEHAALDSGVLAPPPVFPPVAAASLKRSADGDESNQDLELSNARMPKKPKPRPPAPEGAIVADKSCAVCRSRKVRCNRIVPRCDHCTTRNEDCDLKDWRPKPKIKPTDPARVAALEARLAELEEQLARGHSHDIPAAAFVFPAHVNEFSPTNAIANNHSATRTGSAEPRAIGHRSLDWRLAEPHMAVSLARHLCESFYESCCFLLPTFEWFRPRMSDFLQGKAEDLPASLQVAFNAFCAVGARTSPHSALLGISLKPEDELDHPNAPLLSAGTRRQNACQVLLDKAYDSNYQQGILETATVENLAALLSILQLALFTEIHPQKSRPLLQCALSHYKELQDSAGSADKEAYVRKCFGFALYTIDCLVSVYSRRKCQIRDDDFSTYFAHTDTKIIVPQLPHDKLQPLVERLTEAIPDRNALLRSAKHLLACWVCACQRAVVQIVAPSLGAAQPPKERGLSIMQVWSAIDQTRAAAQYLLTIAPPTLSPHAHSHVTSAEDTHSVHERDYGAQIIRLDRDLLDLLNILHVHLATPAARDLLPAMQAESLSRVRKALRRRAYYLKCYVAGADVHMTFHELYQLELLPEWTKLALQRVGDIGGPLSAEEEVNQVELGWFIEGLQHSCYYHPLSESRLFELAPHFDPLLRLDLSPQLAHLALPLASTPQRAAAASPQLAARADALRLPPIPPIDPLLPFPSPPTSHLPPPPLGFSPYPNSPAYPLQSEPSVPHRSMSALSSPSLLDFNPLLPMQSDELGQGAADGHSVGVGAITGSAESEWSFGEPSTGAGGLF
ncbi:Zn(II)2Cys6 transcription factor [Rhodotorula paludigena]|uniref:Zn(II)2Cys6 transcription factor n=1 Tax=Rhodotorula paludigena TaxID=86838 RepID=UPI00316E6FF0